MRRVWKRNVKVIYMVYLNITIKRYDGKKTVSLRKDMVKIKL
jgi:hypothetical protein